MWASQRRAVSIVYVKKKNWEVKKNKGGTVEGGGVEAA